MKTVLIVDDEFDLTGTLRAILETAGYRAEACHNGKQALQRMASSPKPDLVLLDIMMPVMSGLEVLHEMRKAELVDIPVILMSSAPLRIPGDEYSFHSMLHKPFSMTKLLNKTEQILGYPAT